MPFDSTQTPRDPRQRLQSSAYQPTNRGGPGNPGTANNMPQNDPFNQYGYGAQSPQLGRYVPPMLQDRNNPQSWGQQGGYAYNIPNSYGSPSWNQFNSTDRAPQDLGQVPQGGFNRPVPQLSPQDRSPMPMFAGLPGMSSIVDPYRDQLRPRPPQGGYENAGPTTPGLTGVVTPQIQANYGMTQGKPVSMDGYTMGPQRPTSDGDGYGGEDDGQYTQGPYDKNRFTEAMSNIGRNIGNSFRNEMREVGQMFKPGGFTNSIRDEWRQLQGMMGFGQKPQGSPPAVGTRPAFSGAGPRPVGSQMGPNQPYTVPTYGGGSGGSSWPGNQEYFRPMPEQDRGPQQPYTVPTYGGGPSPGGPRQGGVVRPITSNRGRSASSLNAARGEMSDDRIRNAVADMRAHEWRGRS